MDLSQLRTCFARDCALALVSTSRRQAQVDFPGIVDEPLEGSQSTDHGNLYSMSVSLDGTAFNM